MVDDHVGRNNKLNKTMNWNEAMQLTKKSKQTSEPVSFSAIVGGILVGGVLFLFFGLPLIAYFVWAYALVLKTLWAWFICPVFGLNPLSWAQAWGLIMLVGLLTHQYPSKPKDERDTTTKVIEIAVEVLRPWVALLAGWVCAHYFLHIV
jgi:hypothetical protein